MKIYIGLVLFGLTAFCLQAQVRCTLAAGPVGADGKLSAQLTVAIEPGWHIASLTQPDGFDGLTAGGGPVRTVIALADGQPFKLAGLIKGPKPHVEPSEAFGVDVETYEGTVTFVLPLEATGDVPFDELRARPLVVEITYQACTDETCLLPKTDRVACEIGNLKSET